MKVLQQVGTGFDRQLSLLVIFNAFADDQGAEVVNDFDQSGQYPAGAFIDLPGQSARCRGYIDQATEAFAYTKK